MRRILFYILWPLVWVYAPLNRRVRLVISHNGSLVLVKNEFGPGVWQLPGGGIKFGETVEAAAIREAEEELGVKLTKVSLLCDEMIVVKQFGLLMRYHFVFVALSEQTLLDKSRELTDATWCSYATKKRVAKEVRVGIKLARQQR